MESVSCMTALTNISEWVRTWGYLMSSRVGAGCSAMGLSVPSDVFARNNIAFVLW